MEKSSSQLVELLILSPNVSKLACGLKMAYMSDELYPYLENKACSLVWIIFASRKLMLDYQRKSFEYTFIWQLISSKLKYRSPSNKSVNCILFIPIYLALNIKYKTNNR